MVFNLLYIPCVSTMAAFAKETNWRWALFSTTWSITLAYSIADVVVSASVEPEAFGRVAVESQAMGKPIVASNIGGSKETVLNKKSGFLYKHDDPRELAKSLNTVIHLSQEELKLMGNEGRKNVSKKFDVEVMCDSNLREYRKLLKN